jgi:hypothetical protein
MGDVNPDRPERKKRFALGLHTAALERTPPNSPVWRRFACLDKELLVSVWSYWTFATGNGEVGLTRESATRSLAFTRGGVKSGM